MSLVVSKSSSEGVFLDVRDAPRPWKTREKEEEGMLLRAHMLREAAAPASAQLLALQRLPILLQELNEFSDSECTAPTSEVLFKELTGPGTRTGTGAPDLYLN